MISLPAFALVWWRMLLVVLALALVPAFWRGVRRLDRRLLLVFAGIGVVVALHWVTFYGAIKLSNASVAATCMGVAPIMMSVVEPWITGRRFDPRELLIGVAAVPGVALVVGGTPQGMHLGIAVGVLSALLVAVFGSLNKRFVEAGEPLAVTGLELAAGTGFLTVLALVFGVGGPAGLPLPGARDAVLLLVLSLACTLFPFALSLVALRQSECLQRAARGEPGAGLCRAAGDAAVRRAAGTRACSSTPVSRSSSAACLRTRRCSVPERRSGGGRRSEALRVSGIDAPVEPGGQFRARHVA